MPWATPTLREVRSLVRDSIRGSLPGADALIPNSVLRVLSDNQGAVCHLNLQYLDWEALQLLPDTAETEWLDRHADIWLQNADGSTGRKMATLAEGTVAITSSIGGIVIPVATQLDGTDVSYETTAEAVTAFSGAAIEVAARALDPGVVGNLAPGSSLSAPTIANIGGTTIVVVMDGGVDTENDDDLRIRVLERIRQPPQGGAAHDYVRWAKAVSGVTRAWCTLEMGMGTVSVRVMFDELRADNDGFPIFQDLVTVTNYIDTVRPVAVKDFWVLAPLKQRVEAVINDLTPDTLAVRAAIEMSLREMLLNYAAPGQTIYAAWKYQAISNTPGVISFAMGTALDDVMQTPGHIAVLGDIIYGG